MWLRLRQKSGDEDRKSCRVCAICKISAPTEQIGVSVATNAVTDSTLGEVTVELRDVRKTFGTNEVLHGINLTVSKGEHVVLFGPSGSGKSTILRSINLLEVPSSGSVKFNGVEYGPGDPTEESVIRGRPLELRRSIGMVFQQFNLFPHLTAIHNIALPLRSVKKMSRRDAEEKAAQSLRDVGLLQWSGSFPAQMSGGQQQRVAIARALSLDPEVMLFDEPTSALDPELVGEVLSVMRRLATMGMTMVVVTHELGFAREVGDHNVFMEEGQIVETGGRGFFESCSHPRTQAFMGSVL